MSKYTRKTTKQFKKEVEEIVGNEFIVLGEYKTAKDKIEFKHTKCGTIFYMTPDSFLRGNRCKICSRKRMSKEQRKTTEQYKKEVYNKFKNEYEVLGEYINAKTKIKVKHNVCGRILETIPKDLLSNKGCCKICSAKKVACTQRKTNENFIKEVEKITDGEYTPLTKYEGNKVKVLMRHNKCKNVFEVTPAHFVTKNNPTRCPECQRKLVASKRTKTNEKFINQVYELVEDEYTFLEKYIHCEKKIKVKHNKCGHIYSVRPIGFLNGNRCPYCCQSKGEQKIMSYLYSKNIKFETQYKLEGCRGTRRVLPFDIAVLNRNNTLNMLIEFDGIQHNIEVGFFGGEKGLKIRKKNDLIKDDYCKSHGIKLLRIPYEKMEFINEILDKELDINALGYKSRYEQLKFIL